jgi:hypothetical protein
MVKSPFCPQCGRLLKEVKQNDPRYKRWIEKVEAQHRAGGYILLAIQMHTGTGEPTLGYGYPRKFRMGMTPKMAAETALTEGE